MSRRENPCSCKSLRLSIWLRVMLRRRQSLGDSLSRITAAVETKSMLSPGKEANKNL